MATDYYNLVKYLSSHCAYTEKQDLDDKNLHY